MKRRFYISIIMAFLASGCVNAPSRPSGLPLRYHNAQYDFTFFLAERWRGYSVLIQQWEGVKYSPTADKQIVVGDGPMITLRHPQWQASARYQDIPILVFTRAQWDALHQGKLWPSLFAGGIMHELWHNRKYVFALSSRYNADDSVKDWREVANIVEQNCAVHKMPRLYSE